MSLQERERRLLTLALILVPVFLWIYVPKLFQGGGGARAKASQPSFQERSKARIEVVDLDLEALEAPLGDHSPKRNIFSFHRPPPPPPPPQVRRELPPPPPPPPPPPSGPAVPRPPPIDVELVGIFGPDHRRIAVLRDEESIINVLQDEVVKDKFIVQNIGYQSIDLGFVGFPDEPAERVEIGSSK